MLDRIWDDGGALTGLINNAAGNFISRTEDLSPRAFDAIASTVFHGSFYITLECGKRWLAAGQRANVLSTLVTWRLERLGVHRALRHVESGSECDDAIPGGGVGVGAVSASTPSRRGLSNRERCRQVGSHWAAKPGVDVPMQRAGRCPSWRTGRST